MVYQVQCTEAFTCTSHIIAGAATAALTIHSFLLTQEAIAWNIMESLWEKKSIFNKIGAMNSYSMRKTALNWESLEIIAKLNLQDESGVFTNNKNKKKAGLVLRDPKLVDPKLYASSKPSRACSIFNQAEEIVGGYIISTKIVNIVFNFRLQPSGEKLWLHFSFLIFCIFSAW